MTSQSPSHTLEVGLQIPYARHIVRETFCSYFPWMIPIKFLFFNPFKFGRVYSLQYLAVQCLQYCYYSLLRDFNCSWYVQIPVQVLCYLEQEFWVVDFVHLHFHNYHFFIPQLVYFIESSFCPYHGISFVPHFSVNWRRGYAIEATSRPTFLLLLAFQCRPLPLIVIVTKIRNQNHFNRILL